MKTTCAFALVLGLFSAATVTAFAKIERVVEKSFTVQPGGTLRVETQGGDVRVGVSSDNVVKITARQKIRASSDAEADELLKKLDLIIEQNGNDVAASAKHQKPAMGFHFGSWPPVSVDFTVTVPAAYLSDVRTSGGDIVIGDVSGKVNVRTSGGGIKLGKIAAPVDARTSGGSISLDEALGAVKLNTSGGSVTVGRVVGDAELGTSGGSIKIDSVEGAVRASTSGGSIRAGIVGPLKEDCSLSTSGGSVRVTVDKTAAFQLDASTSGGVVDAEGLTITLDKSHRGRTKLGGAVNGGGSHLRLRTSGGNVVIRTR